MPFIKGHKFWEHPNAIKTRFKKGQVSLRKGKKHTEESRKKMSDAHKDTIPWNKGIKTGPLSEEHKLKLSQALKGKQPKNSFNWKDKNHPRWKGDKVGYVALHEWVVKHKGKPKACQKCGATKTQRRIVWANINRKYRRNLKDFISLCYSCHKIHDLKLIKSGI